MRKAVLDASVTAPWFLPDEASEAAEHAYSLLRRGAWTFCVPELWLWECGNVIANAVKRRRLGKSDALLAWSALDSLRGIVELIAPEPAQAGEALQLAIEHDLSIYDAAYLRLAVARGLPLLTADRVLARAGQAAGVGVLAAADLT